jgi:hypothetical protein
MLQQNFQMGLEHPLVSPYENFQTLCTTLQSAKIRYQCTLGCFKVSVCAFKSIQIPFQGAERKNNNVGSQSLSDIS